VIDLGQGAFAVGPRPRGGSWLGQDLLALRELGFGAVVSLLTRVEVVELELGEESALCDLLGLEYFCYPIRDLAVPDDRDRFGAFTEQLFDLIFRQGLRAYCHCSAGLGRSPLLGCSLLVRSGLTISDSWSVLSAKRGQTVPETAEQRNWLAPAPQALPGSENAI
jgi:protein-tyrosine phosphatase